MYPVLFSIGPVHIYGYGFMIALGILAAFFVAVKRAPKHGLDPDAVYSIGLAGAICGFIGAKLFFCIVEFPSFMADPAGIMFSGNGFVVYGGIIGGVLGGLGYCKKKGHDFLRYFDLIMPSIALAQGFGRIGCFLAGCCYGQKTDLPIGVVFTHSDLAPNGVKLIPTQLISSAGDFIIAFALIYLAGKIKEKGNIGLLYIAMYSIGRFAIEFFRADYRGSIGPLSTSQAIAIVACLVALLIFCWNRNRAKEKATSEDAAESAESTEDVEE
ncbi:MAG: prolipoprotein diacylglyceryl transferase [Lachnospiraceae bacterium]|nr:prolipoprotein diacylglyceryl transferase [Lachnospiraceae bacterium]